MKSLLRSFAVIVCVPTLIAAIYFGLIASDQYVSETRFAIRSSGSGGGNKLASLLTSSVISSGGQDSQVVVDYIESQDMLTTLDEKLNIVGHFSHSNIDFLSRLDEDATREELLAYFLKHVEIIEDAGNNIIVLKVSAFTREFAQQLALHIISLSESLVNNLSTRIENDTLERAKAEVAHAAEKVRVVNEKITKFRAVNASINPAEETSALLGLLSGIEIKLSEAKTELSEKRAFMKENTPVVKSLKNKVAALQKQLAVERKRIAGDNEKSTGDEGFSELINDYQPLALEQEMAQQQYSSALTSLELSRIETQRKKRYLVTYVKPVLPDESTEPNRTANTLIVFVYLFLVYGIGGLMWSALRDHVGY